MNHCLKFHNQSAANSVLMDGDAPRYRNIDVIGVIHKPTGAMFKREDGTEYPEMAPLDGWHVNVWLLPDEDGAALQPYIVTPSTPSRVWG